MTESAQAPDVMTTFGIGSATAQWVLTASLLPPAAHVDLSGAALLCLLPAGLVFGAAQSTAWGWTSAGVLVALPVAVLAGVAFVLRERRDALLSRPVQAAAVVAAAAASGAAGGAAVRCARDSLRSTYSASLPRL